PTSGSVAEIFVRAAFGLRPVPAVALLQLAEELVLLARDLLPIAVGQLAPLLPRLALHLIPASLDDVPVHRVPSFSRADCSRSGRRARKERASGIGAEARPATGAVATVAAAIRGAGGSRSHR